MKRQDLNFLGRGWGFPPRFDRHTSVSGMPVGTVGTVADEADIQESLRILMGTARGERIMRPRYGVGLFEHVFDPSDETTLGEFRSLIEEAVMFYEPRIRLEEVEIDASGAPDGVLVITLSYFIPTVNSRSNLVYPFYIQEGTNVRGQGAGGSGALMT